MDFAAFVGALGSGPVGESTLAQVLRNALYALDALDTDGALEELSRAVANAEADGKVATGYLHAISDTLAVLRERASSAEKMRSHEDGAIKNSWAKALDVIEQGQSLPSKIATKLGIDESAVSRVLRELREASLVKQIQPTRGDRRTRPVYLTLDGKRLVDKLRARVDGPLLVAPGKGILETVKARAQAERLPLVSKVRTPLRTQSQSEDLS